MKLVHKLILLVFVFSPLSARTLFAQNLVGTWQGTLQPPNGNRGLRTVIKITRAPEDESLKGVMYSIDQGGQPVPIGSITLQGSTVKMSVPGIAGVYEGKLSGDGSTITGTWSQGTPLPLNLSRATPETAWDIPMPPAALKPMAADANPVFEVASIKPTPPGTRGRLFRVVGRQFTTVNTSLSDLIADAYVVHPSQIIGAPDWMASEKYNLLAQPDAEGQPNDEQVRTMLQKLIADRFKFTFHIEKRDLSVYVLRVGKDGHKLTRNDNNPGGRPSLLFRTLGQLPAQHATMAEFASLLQRAVMDRPVVDQTGLSGRWDFLLIWRPDEFQFASLGGVPANLPPDVANAPDLYSAIEQQLGLKLESTKAPTDVMVIDHVEKPSEN
jgi:uncharacterized protein (TIGR03435 family)